MTIDTLPALDRSSSTFRSDVDTFFGDQLPDFTEQVNELALDLTTKQAIASQAAIDAEADRVATAADRVQTGLDRLQTIADRIQTGLDRAAAAASAAVAAMAAAFSDANPIAYSAGDVTKWLKVNLSALATSQVVTLTVRALNGTIALLSDLTQFLTPMTYYNSGTTNALVLSNGGHQRWAPNTGVQALTISGWAASGTHSDLQIEGVNLGLATITWNAASPINWIKTDGSTTTTFSSNGVTLRTSGIDNVILWTRDGGTTIYGKIIR